MPSELIGMHPKSQLEKRVDDIESRIGGSGGVGEFLDAGHTSERFNDYTGNSSVMRFDHVEGYGNRVLNSNYGAFVQSGCNHLEGKGNTLNGSVEDCTHIEGQGNTYNGDRYGYNHIEGSGNTLSGGMQNHIEGQSNTVTGSSRMSVSGQGHTAAGCSDTIIGGYSNNVSYVQESIVCGHGNTVSGTQSNQIVHAAVFGTDHIYANGNRGAFICGKYGRVISSDQIFVIGNGYSGSNENCFEVHGNNGVYAIGGYHSLGADYAEYFEWADGNPGSEDRCGMLVTTDGDKIVPAHGDDIFGIVSASPSVAGNAFEIYWHGKYVTDIYGRRVTDAHGQAVIAAEFDPAQKYIPRSKRPEWAAVGLTGRLVIRDDGSCKVGGYVSARHGVGTSCFKNTGVRVLRRLDEKHAEVLIK